MKTKLWLALLMSLIVCIGATAKPAAQKPMKPATAAQIRVFAALYDQGDKAFLSRDIQSVRSKMTPDFTLLLFGETFSRAQYIGSMTAFFDQIIKVKTAKTSIQKLEFRGKRAFMEARGTSEFTMLGEDKKPHSFKMVQCSRDSWISTSRGWQIQVITAISEQNYIDGKQVSARS